MIEKIHARERRGDVYALKKKKRSYKSIALRQSFSKLVRRLYLPTKEYTHARAFIADQVSQRELRATVAMQDIQE